MEKQNSGMLWAMLASSQLIFDKPKVLLFPTDGDAHGVSLSWPQRHAQDPCRLRLAGIEMKEDQEPLRGVLFEETR